MSTPAEDHARVTRAVLDEIDSGERRAVVIDSPPGAGKSTFVVDAAELLSRDHVVPIVAQTNAQADDLVAKLRRIHPHLVVGRLIGADGNPNVERSESVRHTTYGAKRSCQCSTPPVTSASKLERVECPPWRVS